MQNRTPVEIRIQRTVSVPPRHIGEFVQASLEIAEHSHKVMGVEPDVFIKRGGHWKNAEFVIHTDFASMAAYEDVFLYGLLFDSTYLGMASKTAHLINDEPLDELFVRLLPDDFFMGLSKKRVHYNFESAQAPAVAEKPKYRVAREYCAAKGRLADVMDMNFNYMDSLYAQHNRAPKYFCSRFSQQRIGCSNLYIDRGDPPPFEAFLTQDQVIARDHANLLLSPPTETLLVRVDRAMANALLP